MKNLIILGSIIGLSIAIGGYYLFFKPNNGISVALLLPAKHPAMDAIVEGFLTQLKDYDSHINCTIYNAQGNKTLLHSQVEVIINQDYDAIVSIGALTSQLVHTERFKRNKSVPHIFIAVDDPVEKGLIFSKEDPKNNTTGVISLSNFEDQINYLLQVKPDVKSILLPFDANHISNNADIVLLKKTTSKKGIDLVLVPLSQTNEIAQKVPVSINGNDALLILKDHLLVSGVPLLARICQKNQIPLYCSDLNSVDNGAALAFGVYEADYGTLAADIVYQVVIEKKDAGVIPIKEIKNMYCKINCLHGKRQGLSLDDYQIKSLKRHGVMIVDE